MIIELHELTYQDYVRKIKKIDKKIFNQVYKNKQRFEYNLVIGKYITINNRSSGFYTLKKKHLDIVNLNDLCVVSKYRGIGIGRILLKDAIKEAKKRKYKIMTLLVLKNNIEARKMYKSSGFKIIDNENNLYTMRKYLGYKKRNR